MPRARSRRGPRHEGRLLASERRRPVVANVVFSLCAALATLIIAILSAFKGATVVAIVWGSLAVGFLVRAYFGIRRGRGGAG